MGFGVVCAATIAAAAAFASARMDEVRRIMGFGFGGDGDDGDRGVLQCEGGGPGGGGDPAVGDETGDVFVVVVVVA